MFSDIIIEETLERIYIANAKDKKFTWFNLDINQVVLVVHELCRGLQYKYNSVYTFIEQNDDNMNYTVIAICSYSRLTKKEAMKLMDELPCYDWENYK